jgi:recombination protein RecA
MSQALRKLTGTVSKTGTSLIFTNQIRMKIGVMFGSPETTSGGNALKFYSSVRMDIRRIGAIKDGDTISGNRTKVKVVKNKVAPPFKTCEFDILYGEGISYEGDLLDIGSAADIVKKSGTWYSYGDQRLGQGKEASRQFLREHPEIKREIDSKVREHFGLSPVKTAAAKTAARAESTEKEAEKAPAATTSEKDAKPRASTGTGKKGQPAARAGR